MLNASQLLMIHDEVHELIAKACAAALLRYDYVEYERFKSEIRKNSCEAM
jgi:hypothetical protein